VPLDGFLCNLVFGICTKIVRRFPILVKLVQKYRILRQVVRLGMIVLYSGDGVLCEVRAEEEQTTGYEVWSVVTSIYRRLSDCFFVSLSAYDISMTDCQSLAKI